MRAGDHFVQRPLGGFRKGLARLVGICGRRPALVFGIILVVTAGAVAYIASHIKIDTATDGLLFKDLPFQRANRALSQAFPQLRGRVVIIVDGDTAGLASRAADRLTHALRTRTDRFIAVDHPGGGDFFQDNGLLYLSPNELQELVNQLIASEPLLGSLSQDPNLRGVLSLLGEGLARAGEEGLPAQRVQPVLDALTNTVQGVNAGRYTPLAWQSLLGGDKQAEMARRQIILAVPRHTDHSADGTKKTIDLIHRTADGLELDPAHGVRVMLTGSMVLSQEQLKSVANDARLTLTVALSLVVLLLAYGLRSARLVFGVLLTLLVGLTWSTAFALAVVGPFNLISVTFAVLFIGLGVDFGIQFCMRFQEELGHGHAVETALSRTTLGAGSALTLAAAAAALSFYSVLPTDYAGIIDLGIIAGSSMFIALLATLTVLPALLALLRVRRSDFHRPPIPFRHLPLGRRAVPVLVLACLVGAASIPLVLKVRFDFDLTRLQNPHNPAVAALRSLAEGEHFSPYNIDILAPDLQTAEHLAHRLGSIPSVGQVITLAAFVPEQQDRKLEILDDARLLIPPSVLEPDTAAAAPTPAALSRAIHRFLQRLTQFSEKDPKGPLAPAAQRLKTALTQFQDHHGGAPEALRLLDRSVTGTLPDTLHHLSRALNARRITLDRLPEGLKANYLNRDGQALVQVFHDGPFRTTGQWSEFVTAVQAVAPSAAGTPVLFVEAGRAVVKAFRETSVVAFALITGLLVVTLRSLRDVVLVLAPLILAALVTMAAMVLLHMPFDLSNIIVLPLMIGLGVAFAIYFVLRWREGPSWTQLLAGSTPEGILFSGLTTLSSIGTLAISSEPAMSSLGRTLGLALVIVLLCVLVLLPALLSLFPRPVDRHHGDGS